MQGEGRGRGGREVWGRVFGIVDWYWEVQVQCFWRQYSLVFNFGNGYIRVFNLVGRLVVKGSEQQRELFGGRWLFRVVQGYECRIGNSWQQGLVLKRGGSRRDGRIERENLVFRRQQSSGKLELRKIEVQSFLGFGVYLVFDWLSGNFGNIVGVYLMGFLGFLNCWFGNRI